MWRIHLRNTSFEPYDGHCYCSGANRSRLFGSLSECSPWLQYRLSKALVRSVKHVTKFLRIDHSILAERRVQIVATVSPKCQACTLSHPVVWYRYPTGMNSRHMPRNGIQTQLASCGYPSWKGYIRKATIFHSPTMVL